MRHNPAAGAIVIMLRALKMHGMAQAVGELTEQGSPAFRALQQRMLKTPGGDREMVEILALVLQHDEQAVLTAVELALEAGAPTKTHILNLLHRLVDGKPLDAPPVKPPGALTLTTEPQANVERYDALRKAGETRHAS